MNEHIELFRKAKSSWLYPIYVPSAFRAGTAPLLNLLVKAPAAVQRKVTIVGLPEERREYERSYPWARFVEERRPGIGPARMRALKDADVHRREHITVLDDDIIHVSLLQRLETAPGKWHSSRYSSRVSGVAEPMALLRSLAVACRLSDVLWERLPLASYGAARNALFSGGVDTSVGASVNKGSFPACVMFFDVERFKMRRMPKAYQYHGEDLAMFLDAMTRGDRPFTLPGVAYDQHGGIETTIPLDPQGEVGRPHLQTTPDDYPDIHPYLRVSMKNKKGGTMRIGMNWKAWYRDTGTEPVDIPLALMMEDM